MSSLGPNWKNLEALSLKNRFGDYLAKTKNIIDCHVDYIIVIVIVIVKWKVYDYDPKSQSGHTFLKYQT